MLVGAGALCEVVPIGRVVEELISSKQAANRRPTYVKALRCYLKMFTRGRDEIPIQSFNRTHLEEWFASRTEAPITRKTGVQLLSVLFSYAIRVGYVERNPVRQLERVSVDSKPPRILSPKEVRRILNYARREMRWRLPNLVLGIYAGIRSSELRRLYWRDINLERGYVTINSAASKTRRRRIVHLDPKCIAWLRRCRTNDRPIGSFSQVWRRLIERNTGIPWSQNIMRQTAASYLIAKHQDAGKVSRMLGNSAEVLLSHYVELVNPEDCRRFWKCPKPKIQTTAPPSGQ